MRYCNFVLALLGIFSIANGSTCKYKHDDDETINGVIKEISVNYNIPECKAHNVYDFIIEEFSFYENAINYSVDNNLSSKKCKNRCKKAYKNIEAFLKTTKNIDILSEINESIDNEELYKKCQIDCNVVPEILSNVESDTNNETTLEKRDNECPAPSEGIINIVDEDFEYGIPRFKQDSSSVETAIVHVNGCGPKLFGKYDIGENYNGLFLPACNSHDVCYDCQKGKEYCDKNFLKNLRNLCDLKYPDTKKLVNKVLHADCYSKARIFYTAVDLFASGSYERCEREFNPDTNCAFCGATVVKEILVYAPYYIKK